MKKILYLLCLLLFTSTVYASDVDVQEKIKEKKFATGSYNPNYVSIDRRGRIAYIINEEEINVLNNKLEDILNYNDFSLQSIEDKKRELKPVTDPEYSIRLYTNDEEGKQAMVFSIYRSFLALNTTNLTELGSIMDGKVYIFENAFIDSQGCLYISMEDWDAIFSPTYGNTKKLSVKNGEIMYNGEMTGVQSKVVGECVFLPLRKTVDYFKFFTLEWDAKLRKIILFEKAE